MGGWWSILDFGAAGGGLLGPPHASELLRRRSGVRGSGMSSRSHPAGGWGGGVRQVEAVCKLLAREPPPHCRERARVGERVVRLLVESGTSSLFGRPEAGS